MAGRVTAVVNQKGGAGKTTLAVNLAAALARRRPTRLLDLDPQGSACQWAAQAQAEGHALPMAVTAAPGAGAATLRRHADEVDELLLDCPPSLEHPASLAALGACDLVLVPVLPSPVDLWASLRLREVLAAAQHERPALRAWLLVNQLEPRSALSAALDAALAEFGMPVLRSRLQRRAAYRLAALDGVSVHALGRRGAAAAAEIDALIEEVYIP